MKTAILLSVLILQHFSFAQIPTGISPDRPGIVTREFITDISMNYPFCGRLSAIAVNPLSSQHIIVAGESGGLFETKNAGGSSRKWSHLSAFNQQAIQDILLLPVPGGIETYITTAAVYYTYTSPLIWKRNKEGVFSKIVFTGAANMLPEGKTKTYRVIQKSTGSAQLIACGDYGLAYTDDSGTWRIKDGPGNQPVYAVAVMSDGSVLAGTRSGIYRAGLITDPWVLASARVSFNDGNDRFALKTDLQQSIAVASVVEGSGYRVYGTTDGGRTWEAFLTRASDAPMAGGYNSVYPDYDAVTKRLTVYASNRFQVDYVTASGRSAPELLRTCVRDRSLEWKGQLNSSNICHSDTRQIVFLRQGVYPEKMVITSDGGFHIANIKTGTGPEGFNWVTENTSSGLKALQVYNITGHDGKFYFGTHDNGFGASVDGGHTFTTKANTRTCDFGGEGSVVPMYGTGRSSTDQTIVLPSLDVYPDKFIFGIGTAAGVTWQSPTSGWGCPIFLNGTTYIQDAKPAEGMTTHPWKKSVNNGRDWTNLPVANYLRTGNLRHGFGVSGSSTTSAGSKYAMYLTLVGPGKTILGKLNDVTGSSPSWSYPALNGLEDGVAVFGSQFMWESVYAVNPDNARHLLAVEQKTGKLKTSTDGGENWSEVTSFHTAYTAGRAVTYKSNSGGPNNNSITMVSYCPWDGNKILVGTDSEGVFYSKDAGRTWRKLNNPGIFMVSGVYWPSASKAFIASYGRGIFRLDL